MSEVQTLVLVDGSSYLYRAFHALPDLRNANGEPTGAIYGVLSMLRRLVADHKAALLGCVFDPKGKTFRDDIYADYKANRPSVPEELAQQIPPLYEAIRAMGWPLIVIDGVEADDVIGTLALAATRQSMKTIISTGDKDLAQLVDDHVTLINTMSNERLDVAGVQSKFGVPPSRIVDYLTLVGDAVDNVPGVDKVGPKTAVKWLAQYESLDGVIANAVSIGGVVGENLRKAISWLPTGKQLVTIKTDVPTNFSIADLAPQPPDREKLRELYARFGFRSWLKEIENGAGGGPAPASAAAPTPVAQNIECRYTTLLTEEDIQRLLPRLNDASLVAFDTETTSLDPFAARLVGMSFSMLPGEAFYLAVAHAYPDAPDQLGAERALAILKPWLEDPLRKKVGQNFKYDQHVLANHGIALRGIEHDTLLQSYVLESHARHDMETLAQRHLGLPTISYDDVTGKGANRIGFEEVAVDRATQYSAEDADITLRLHGALYPQVAADEKLATIYSTIEMPVREVLFRIERNGVLVDVAQLEAQSHALGQKMLELEARAHLEAGQPFNLNSPKQIGEIFFDRLQLPVVKKTPSGAPSTDEEVLEKLALDYPLPKTLLEFRSVSKLKSTYTDKLPKMVNGVTGRVHTNYGQATAVTGRLASTDPNLQNIPVRTAEGRRVREAFIAAPGCMIVSADYSQIELRIMAHLSGDESLLAAFAGGKDIHRATAAEVFNRALAEVSSEERRYAKAINFGLIYGMSAFGLAQQLGVERGTAQTYIDSYFARYPGVKRFMDEIRRDAPERGYVETVFGRRLWLAEIRSGNQARRAGAERAAINAPMQGTAADLIKLAMIAVQGWIDSERLATQLIMQVHDELVLEVPTAELARVRADLPQLMTGVATLRAPLVVDVGVGPNWEQAH
ncbi:MAG: DNA polymerase I [Betaproteobacteria bacterium]|nr:DNA polymerase I [Betaproteobacteria bacterium]